MIRGTYAGLLKCPSTHLKVLKLSCAKVEVHLCLLQVSLDGEGAGCTRSKAQLSQEPERAQKLNWEDGNQLGTGVYL